MIHSEPLDDDEVLLALAAVTDVLAGCRLAVDLVARRAHALQTGRAAGETYATLLVSAESPLVVDVMTDLIGQLTVANGRLRRAEARALHGERLSMEKISLLLGVSRQRVSVLIRHRDDGPAATASPVTRPLGLALTGPEVRMIAESIPHIVWIARADGSPEYFSRSGVEFAGLPAEPSDEEWWSMVHPDDVERLQHTWTAAVATETLLDAEVRLRNVDAEYRWHRLRSLPIRGPDGRVTRWLGTAIAIDEQRQHSANGPGDTTAQDALALVATVEGGAPIGIGAVDGDFRVVRMNDRLARVNGAPVAGQIGRAASELFGELWPPLSRAFETVRDTGELVVDLEVSGATPSAPGRTGQWLSVSYPIRTGDAVVGVAFMLVDRALEYAVETDEGVAELAGNNHELTRDIAP